VALHRGQREPRAHWLLLALFLVVLLGELALNGYVTGAGVEGTQRNGQAAGVGPGLRDGQPVIRVDPTGSVSARAMPAGTVALTFDDGPDPVWTPQILAVLAHYRVNATFFEVGARVDDYPALARRVLAGGNEIGSHTFTHADPATTAGWRYGVELSLTSSAIAAATGRVPVLMRPPYSSRPSALTSAEFAAMRRAGAAGYLTVLTDLDTRDWERPGVDAIVAAAQPAPGAGAVVMMHDSGGNRSQTVGALNILIPKLLAQGYRFATVSQALGLGGEPAASTIVRVRGTALRWAQTTAGGLARALTVLMLAAVALGALRLAAQLVGAWVHVRRVRRRPRRRRYLGPVSVIVPAHNEAANIAATVRSLVASDYPQLEVIVVDDGSTDGTARIVRQLRLPEVSVISQPNAGKPAALNTGIRHARGEILVLVDGDTVFQRDAVGRLIQPMRDEQVGAVSGNTKVANRKGLLGRWQHLEYVIGFNLDRRLFDVARCMPTVPGAIGGFRRAALRDVGGVSAQTLAEDTDLTMAVIRAGWRVEYTPDAVAWTEAPASLRQLWRQRYRWCYGTMQAMWKHRRSLLERGPAGQLGRRGLSYLLLFQVLLPLCAPLVDVYGLYGMIFLPATRTALVWFGFLLVQLLTAAIALRLDRERFTPLWSLPFQQIVYRQLMYLVAVQSSVMALLGGRLRWHRMQRTGAATAHARSAGAGRVGDRRM
jgi:cellulose synthase/poly-beta-1,6-N-acetylglucosamine synthase-like glycosyltransferase/peptidoglycan/xylan/chitin deacetylase (PgdA/CDA1 family)